MNHMIFKLYIIYNNWEVIMRVVPYDKKYKDDFINMNKAWIIKCLSLKKQILQNLILLIMK